MNNLPELVTHKIWKYYWQNKKQNYLQDIRNKKHKLLYKHQTNVYDNINVFARNFNILSIMSGMGGLTYKN